MTIHDEEFLEVLGVDEEGQKGGFHHLPAMRIVVVKSQFSETFTLNID